MQRKHSSNAGQCLSEQRVPESRAGIVARWYRSRMCHCCIGSLCGRGSGCLFDRAGADDRIAGHRLPAHGSLVRAVAHGLCVCRPDLCRENSVLKLCRPRDLSRPGIAGKHGINGLLKHVIRRTPADAPCSHAGVVHGPHIG